MLFSIRLELLSSFSIWPIQNVVNVFHGLIDYLFLNVTLFQGRFRVQAEMVHGHDIVGCFHVEMDIKRSGGGGFLFG